MRQYGSHPDRRATQYEAALALYDGPLLHTLLRPLALNLCNASALLWRLDTLGCDVSERWRDLPTAYSGASRPGIPMGCRPLIPR